MDTDDEDPWLDAWLQEVNTDIAETLERVYPPEQTEAEIQWFKDNVARESPAGDADR